MVLEGFGGDAWEKVDDDFRANMTNSAVVRDTESLRAFRHLALLLIIHLLGVPEICECK